MSDEKNSRIMLTYWISWRRFGPWVLGLAVLSAAVFGPLGLPMYMAGFLKSILLCMLLVFASLIGWATLWLGGCIHLVGVLRARRRATDTWASMALVVPLVFALYVMRATPYPIVFQDGLIGRLEMRTDIEAVQTWVELLDPNECLADPHVDHRGRNLTKGQLPQVLQHQDGMVRLELDAEGRPRVRLSWFEGKGGTWGLVIGCKDMRTPPSEPQMYGEQRAELRPGIYFWIVEG